MQLVILQCVNKNGVKQRYSVWMNSRVVWSSCSVTVTVGNASKVEGKRVARGGDCHMK